MRRLLAEHIQMALAGRDVALERDLDSLARTYDRGAPVAPVRQRFQPGVLLEREHAGQVHRVEVVENGFVWNGRRMKTLSEIAREITGVRWNGPRFFGLRDPQRPS